MQFPKGSFDQTYRGFRISYVGDSMRTAGSIEPLAKEAIQATALACWMTPVEWMPIDGEDLESFKKRTAAAVDSLLSEAASVQETPIEYRGISIATRVNLGRDARWGWTAILMTERDNQVFWGISGTEESARTAAEKRGRLRVDELMANGVLPTPPDEVGRTPAGQTNPPTRQGPKE